MKKFKKVDLKASEIHKIKQEISEWKIGILRPSFKNWKILLFLIPPILAALFLLIKYNVDIDWISVLKIILLLTILFSLSVILRLIELRLGFKRIRKFEITYSVSLLGFKIFFLKWFFPIVVSTKNESYTFLKIHDTVQIELTGLFRFLKLSIRENASL
ncbi:hypothetical protein [Pedobacter sp. MW01-1-1]|uniref:hypothetical protein n=1 Tax=Pedobacter sp. MW01-1-1 TaxID=3383027 RepID=UPI003FEFA996